MGLAEHPKLNKEQQKAVDCINGNLLILASAGTGKTTTIVERYVNMVQNHRYKPSEILMTTFTNRAAKDMISKIVKRTGEEPPYVGTMHSLFLRILRANATLVGLKTDFNIIDESDKKKIVKNLIKKQGIDNKRDNLQYFLSWISKFKNRGILSENLSEEHSIDDIKQQGVIEEVLDDEIITYNPLLRKSVNKIYKKYDLELRRQNLLDFDDVLLFTRKLLENHEEVKNFYSKKFRAIMVDEAQDLNVVQIDIIGLLSNNNLCVIGDDCQNIYEWRGSSPELVFSFNKDQNKITLQDNYRSGKNIISSVNSTIADMKFKIDKKLCCTKNSEGEVAINGFFSFEDELNYLVEEISTLIQKKVLKEDIAVLFRTNKIGKDVERKLKKHKIPCHLSKSVSFFEREEIKDILSFLKLKVNPYNLGDFGRTFLLVGGFGRATIKKIEDLSINNVCSPIQTLKSVQIPKINPEKIKKIKSFVELIENFDKNPLDLFLTDFGYLKLMKNKYKDDGDKLDDKLENISVLAELFKGYSNSKEDIQNFLDSLIEIDKKEKTRSRITLSTIHGAKGLEWKYVFLISCNDKILPFYKKNLEVTKRESELRLFYVAISRAIECLKISHSVTNFGNYYDRSEFLDIIEKHTNSKSIKDKLILGDK